MRALGIILARAGSRGLAGKNTREVAGRPMIAWTLDHARAARNLDRIIVSTDAADAARIARERGIGVVDRPGELATDTAPVAAAARHALLTVEAEAGARYDAAVILYANVPLRPHDLIDRALDKLRGSGCDSVQSVCPVGKMHPYWMKTLTGPDNDRLEPFIENSVHRRQDLPPVYALDGGLIAVRRDLLADAPADRPHAFLGADRRAVVTRPGEVVDVDTALDLEIAEVRCRRSEVRGQRPEEGMTSGLRPLTSDRYPLTSEQRFHIADRLILGPLRTPVYIIAEIGVNHDGSVERALELTRAAKEAGADAVKLQLFDARLLLSAEAELAEYQRDTAADPCELLNTLRLCIGDMLAVRRLAHELGLGFIVTPFSIESVDDMRALGPDAVKIASPDAVNRPLIETMMTLGRPLVISVGACDENEIRRTVAWCWGRPFALLGCVSAYPAPSEQCMVQGVGSLARLGASAFGYSDHTQDVHTGALAVFRDASIIEKHLTYDTSAPGPDHAASLDPARFAEYVRLIRLAERQCRFSPPEAHDQPLPIERDVRRVSRQSICAVRDLAAGHTLIREDLTVKRPGTGIPAARLGELVGRRLEREVRANHLLREGDVRW